MIRNQYSTGNLLWMQKRKSNAFTERLLKSVEKVGIALISSLLDFCLQAECGRAIVKKPQSTRREPEALL